MIATGPAATDRAAELRRAFDISFAAPPAGARPATVDLISIRLDDRPHAIRMDEIDSLHAGVAITAVPSPVPELLGIAGFRGVVIPVYDLAALLGHPAATGRWLVLDSSRALAFAFDIFDGHFRIETTAIASQQDKAAGGHLNAIAQGAKAVQPVIDIPSLVAAIRSRATSFAREQ